MGARYLLRKLFCLLLLVDHPIFLLLLYLELLLPLPLAFLLLFPQFSFSFRAFIQVVLDWLNSHTEAADHRVESRGLIGIEGDCDKLILLKALWLANFGVFFFG